MSFVGLFDSKITVSSWLLMNIGQHHFIINIDVDMNGTRPSHLQSDTKGLSDKMLATTSMKY